MALLRPQFNSIVIHRGRYTAAEPRRTFMASFNKRRLVVDRMRREGEPSNNERYFLEDRAYLECAAPRTREYFRGPAFLGLYAEAWRRENPRPNL